MTDVARVVVKRESGGYRWWLPDTYGAVRCVTTLPDPEWAWRKACDHLRELRGWDGVIVGSVPQEAS